jgi:hypothetical protein
MSMGRGREPGSVCSGRRSWPSRLLFCSAPPLPRWPPPTPPAHLQPDTHGPLHHLHRQPRAPPVGPRRGRHEGEVAGGGGQQGEVGRDEGHHRAVGAADAGLLEVRLYVGKLGWGGGGGGGGGVGGVGGVLIGFQGSGWVRAPEGGRIGGGVGAWGRIGGGVGAWGRIGGGVGAWGRAARARRRPHRGRGRRVGRRRARQKAAASGEGSARGAAPRAPAAAAANGTGTLRAAARAARRPGGAHREHGAGARARPIVHAARLQLPVLPL